MQIQDIVKKYANDDKLFNQIQRQISLKNIALDDIAQIQSKIYIDEEDEDSEVNGFELYKYFLQTKIVAQHLLNLFKNKEYFSSISKNMIFNQFDYVDRSYIAAIRSGNPTIDIVTKVILDYVILLRILSSMKESTIIDANHSENDVEIPLTVENNSSRNKASKIRITPMSSKKLSEPEANTEPACMYCDTKFSPNDEKCSVCEAVVPNNVAITSLKSESKIRNFDGEDFSGYRNNKLHSFPLTGPHPSQNGHPRSISVNYPTVIPKESTKAPNVDSCELPLNGRHGVECTYCNSPNEYNAERCKTCLGEFDDKFMGLSTRLKDRSMENRPEDRNKNKEMNKENVLEEDFSGEPFSIKVRDCKQSKVEPVGEEGGHPVVLRNSGNDRRLSGSNKSLNLKVKEKNVDNATHVKTKSLTIGTKSGWTCNLCSFLNTDIKLHNCQVCMKGLRPEEDKGISNGHKEGQRKSPRSPKKTTEVQPQRYTICNNKIYGSHPFAPRVVDKRSTFNEATVRNQLQNANQNETLTSSSSSSSSSIGDPENVTQLASIMQTQKREKTAVNSRKVTGGRQTTFTPPKKDENMNAESKLPQIKESLNLNRSNQGISPPNVHTNHDVRVYTVVTEGDWKTSSRHGKAPSLTDPQVASNSFQQTRNANPTLSPVSKKMIKKSEPDETSLLSTSHSKPKKSSFSNIFVRICGSSDIRQCSKCEHSEGREKYANLCKKCYNSSCEKCQKGVAKSELNQLCKKCFNKSCRECHKKRPIKDNLCKKCSKKIQKSR